MSKKEDVNKMLIYYQEFHHKCVTWYITAMGFFIVGTIVSKAETNAQSVLIGSAISVLTFLFSATFFLCIFHYSARIQILNGWVSQQESNIPDDWYEKSKGTFLSVKGVGSIFFAFLVILFQLSVWLIAGIKFWS